MPVPIWAGHYIGLPFKGHGRERSGLDCWGLVRLVMAERCGIALPSYIAEYTRPTDSVKISRLIGQEAVKWDRVEAGSETLADVIVLRMRGKPMHVGFVLGDCQMLHIEQGIDSIIEKYNGSRWQDRLHGFYRYRKIQTGKNTYDKTPEDPFAFD